MDGAGEGNGDVRARWPGSLVIPLTPITTSGLVNYEARRFPCDPIPSKAVSHVVIGSFVAGLVFPCDFYNIRGLSFVDLFWAI